MDELRPVFVQARPPDDPCLPLSASAVAHNFNILSRLTLTPHVKCSITSFSHLVFDPTETMARNSGRAAHL